MKHLLPISIILFHWITGYTQQNEIQIKGFRIGAQYSHEFVLDGYVQVREWDLMGDKMELKDLGMESYHAYQFNIEKGFRKNRWISLTYDNYLMQGNSTFNRDIAFNGTLIDGTRGIDVSPTKYFRVSLNYRGTLLHNNRSELQYVTGLAFDHITFWLDGQISLTSTRDERYEKFGRQAFPYPIVGLKGLTRIGKMGTLNALVSGTYVPKFKSFYKEVSSMYLQYNTLLVDLNYSHALLNWNFTFGTKLRHLYLFQESVEDTNIIRTLTAGPYVGITYNF